MKGSASFGAAVGLLMTSLVGVAGASGAGASAAGPGGTDAAPDVDFIVVWLYHCLPANPEMGEVRTVPQGSAVAVQNELLLGAYEGDCEAFYAQEVYPRRH